MKVQELLQDPKKWTKHAFARDTDGNDTSERNTFAVSYCLAGAVYKCYGFEFASPILVKIEKELDSSGQTPIGCWNDMPGRTHKHVLDLATKLDI